MSTWKKPGYVTVETDELLPCPFCGADAELKQSALILSSDRQRSQFVFPVHGPMESDKFWCVCTRCGAGPQSIQETAQAAAKLWNQRSQP